MFYLNSYTRFKSSGLTRRLFSIIISIVVFINMGLYNPVIINAAEDTGICIGQTGDGSRHNDEDECLLSYMSEDEFASGSGTESDPWQIATFEHLDNVRNYLGAENADKHFKLIAVTLDLDVAPYNTGNGWEPIGMPGSSFTGTFDGNGNTIAGLFIDRGDTSNIGLFGYTEGAKIRNLKLEGVKVTGKYNTGGLVGWNEDTEIFNCHIEGEVTGNDSVGGLIGSNYNGTVIASGTSCTVIGKTGIVGGLVGYNEGNISGSYAEGDVFGENLYVGGLVGRSDIGNITGCYVTGNVVSAGDYVGGLSGFFKRGVIYRSYATCSVVGINYIGGLVGLSWSAEFNSSYAVGNVSGNVDFGAYIGGLVGFLDECDIENCYAVGSVEGWLEVGGLIGSIYNSTISYAYAAGNVNGSIKVGSLVGYNDGGVIGSTFWNTETSGTAVGGGDNTDDITGLLTSEMKKPETFINAGWSFTEVWMIREGLTYPYLRWQTPLEPTPVLEGEMWAWGGNYESQVGDNTLVNRHTPVLIDEDDNWMIVTAGYQHTVALKSDGSLWVWGSNRNGQLGDGTYISKRIPTRIGNDNDWAAIAAGEEHTVALKTDGSLWAWGKNAVGQLGDDTTDNKDTPTRIGTDNDWVKVYAGGYHTVAIKSDGSLWAWGSGYYGQLGNGAAGGYAWSKIPIEVTGNDRSWTAVAVGQNYTVALKADGSLWAWGQNNYGQLGDGTTVNKNIPMRIGVDTDWKVITAGEEHTVAIKNDGSLWAWGRNQFGTLGNGTIDGYTGPPYPDPTRIGSDKDWASVTAGYRHNVALKTDGSLWLWGHNGTGQLGDGTTAVKSTPQRLEDSNDWLTMAAGDAHTVAIKAKIPPVSDPDADTVAADKAALTFDVIRGDENIDENNIIANLNLITSGANGTGISWSSGDTAYISNTGAVTRPPYGTSDQTVILTATITKGNSEDTKEFVLIVLRAQETDIRDGFAPQAQYPVGGYPYAIAAGDFDNDGIVDLAVTNTNDGSISILIGDSDGTFQNSIGFNCYAPLWITTGYLVGGDDIVDIALTSSDGRGGLLILEGNGDGTFDFHSGYGTGNSANTVVTGDFNNDDRTDIAVTDYHTEKVVIFLQKEDGSFGHINPNNSNWPRIHDYTYTVGKYPARMVIGDFNGDEKTDLVVVNSHKNSRSFSVLLGNGDGTFSVSTVTIPFSGYQMSSQAYALGIAAGDIDGDGASDLAIGIVDEGLNKGYVTIFKGNGDGTFFKLTDVPAIGAVVGVTLADFNSDGKADIAVANYQNDSISVFHGDGEGGFLPEQNFVTGESPINLVAVDLNFNGKTDLAVVNSNDYTVSILYNRYTGGEPGMTDEDAVAADKAALTFDVIRGDENIDENNIIANLNLITSGANGTGISWSSGDTAYISNTGAVTRPPYGTSDQTVILTATITKGNSEDTKEFVLIVKEAVNIDIDVCEIVGGIRYITLNEALTAAVNGQIIRLLSDINYDGGISITGKQITFDLNGFTLNVVNASGTGLSVFYGEVNLTGDGEFNVTGSNYGVLAMSGTATVTNATAVGTNGVGANTSGGSITVRGNAEGIACGASAASGSVTVVGNAVGGTYGVSTSTYGIIIVNGNVEGNSRGAYAIGGRISVVGNVKGTTYGAYAYNNGNVTVNGNTTADYIGAHATGNGSITVNGNVTADIGVYAGDGGSVTVVGNVNGITCGASAANGNVTVRGNVVGTTTGAFAGSSGGIVTVEGNVTAEGTDGIGARAEYGGKVAILGIISAPTYIKAGDEEMGINDYMIPTVMIGYRTYTDGASTVLVKGGTGVIYRQIGVICCEIEGGLQYTTLDDAIAEVEDGQNIRLLADIYYDGGIFISDRQIIFDLNGFKVEVVNATGTGVLVKDGVVGLTGAGEFNVTGLYFGARAMSGGTVTVTNAMALADHFGVTGVGAFATGDGSCITVLGDTVGTGVGAHVSEGNITVVGNVVGAYIGTYADDGGKVIVGGNVTAEEFDGTGAWAKNAGEIIIDGIIIAPVYIKAGSVVNGINDYITVGTMDGYRIYTDGTSTVRVKATGVNNDPPSVPDDDETGLIPSTPINATVEAGTYLEDLVVTVDSGMGVATVSPVESVLNVAFENTDADSDGVKTVTIEMPVVQGTDTYVLQLPSTVLASENADRKIEMKSEVGTITLPDNMLKGSEVENSGNVSISIGKANTSTLPQDILDILSGRPIVELKLTAGSITIEWNNPDAPVTVSIPYIPTEEELMDSEHIVIWYIDGSGNAVSVPNGMYDPVTGMVTFTTTHFSKYAVAYVKRTFSDLRTADWAKKEIEVLASKGILTGTSETKYSPHTNITRAEFLYYLVRTLGVDTKIDENFDDISIDAYYYKEIAIAKKLGITNGTGNNKFSPDVSITRQDMIVLIERALRILKKLKVQGTASDLDKFADKSLVAAYAVKGVASILKEGLIISGEDKINPLGNITRAEAAVFLYKIYHK